MGDGGKGDDVAVTDPLANIGQWKGRALVLRCQALDRVQVLIGHFERTIDKRVLTEVPQAGSS